MICPKCKEEIDHVNFKIEPDLTPNVGDIDISDDGICVGKAHLEYENIIDGYNPIPTFTCPECKFDLTEFIDAEKFWDLF